MIIEQIYTSCLAEASYYIESEGVAAVIDPLREPNPYLERANAAGAKIQYVFETHFHADFVSGHIELAEKTGANIVFGPLAETSFPSLIATDHQIFQIGKITVEVLHTPGHTPESSCFLLRDEKGNPHCLFTGDTLFIGDVGRPDLAISKDRSTQELAGMLYHSLHDKVMPLPDEIIVYPAHGAGSACGKNMSKETFDTLGHQKQVNYALQAKSKEQFIEEVTYGIANAPSYFAKNATLNKYGYTSLDAVIAKGLTKLNSADVENALLENQIVLDCRQQDQFRDGHIKGSIFIGINGQFAIWAATVLPDLHIPIILVSNHGQEEEAITRLARVGFDNIVGHLEGGISAWEAAEREIRTVPQLTAEDFANHSTNYTILDVRKESEFAAATVSGAQNHPLDNFMDQTPALDISQSYAVFCGGGYRSMIAWSILNRKQNFNMFDVQGGFSNIQKCIKPQIV